MADNVVYLETPKDPQTEEDFNWVPGPQLQAGDSIAEIVKCFVARGDKSLFFVTQPTSSTDGLAVSARLGGGRLGERYRVTLRYRTVLGEVLDLSLEFDCRST